MASSGAVPVIAAVFGRLVVEMVEQSTKAFLDTLVLNEVGQARADISLALAMKLDQAVESTSAGVAQSVAGIARELRDSLTELADAGQRQGNPVRDLFAVPAA